MLQWTGRHIWLGQYHQHSSCSPIRIIRPRRQIQSWCSSVQHPFYMLCFRRRISSRPFLEALKWTFQNHLAWTTSLPTLACLWPKSSHVKISIINSDIFAAMTRFWPIYWLVAGCVVECRICNREVAGSNLSLGYFAPRSTQPSIPSGSVNEYQLRLGRQRQVWFIQIADERVGVQVSCEIPWEHVRYLSASAAVIHYEEALYQVYAPCTQSIAAPVSRIEVYGLSFNWLPSVYLLWKNWLFVSSYLLDVTTLYR